jgi:hypothetical protein
VQTKNTDNRFRLQLARWLTRNERRSVERQAKKLFDAQLSLVLDQLMIIEEQLCAALRGGPARGKHNGLVTDIAHWFFTEAGSSAAAIASSHGEGH